MAFKQHEIEAIAHFLPDGTAEDVIAYMHEYKIHLKVQRDRKSILGDYRPAHGHLPHRISINASLNKYHFLITLIHELAHLINHLQYQNKVAPHGAEWKSIFAQLLQKFIAKKVFPSDIENALHESMRSLAASTCSDPKLFRVLHQYDTSTRGIMIEQLQIGDLFQIENGRVFKLILKRRTRYECEEIKTGKKYLFPGIYEVSKE